ncbi:hypothetical protein F5Y18DRAFT_431191 [Xylariaceae sp. FL1019]|nr:hypothetical protein F5Y18DRAFT_431191 [Xylariaceae sp. FL1019]
MDHQSDEQTAEDRRNLMFGYWPVHPDDEASLLGLNVMIIVLRQIYSVLPDDLVPTVGNETARILQVARSKSHEGNWSSIINKKLGAMYDICPDWKEQARHQSFISLIESDLMIESFWARPCFHLYHNCVYYKPPDGDWSPHQKPASNLAIGKASLIRYTGELSLGHHISRIFSVRTMEPPGWHYLRFCKWPQLIRVHYTPASAPESAPGFHDLCHLTINARYLEKSSIDDTKVDFRSTANVRYKLIAVVRLRSNDEAIDLVRLYNRHHTTMQPPDDAKRFFSNDWKLGEPGSSYMMFYLRDMYHGRRVKAPREFSSEADPCTQRLRWFQESLSRPRDEDSARRLEPRPISDESTTSPPDSNPGSAPPPATQPKPIVPSSKAGTSSSSGFGQGNVSSFGAGKVSSFAAESSPADEEDNTAGIGTHVAVKVDLRRGDQPSHGEMMALAIKVPVYMELHRRDQPSHGEMMALTITVAVKVDLHRGDQPSQGEMIALNITVAVNIELQRRGQPGTGEMMALTIKVPVDMELHRRDQPSHGEMMALTITVATTLTALQLKLDRISMACIAGRIKTAATHRDIATKAINHGTIGITIDVHMGTMSKTHVDTMSKVIRAGTIGVTVKVHGTITIMASNVGTIGTTMGTLLKTIDAGTIIENNINLAAAAKT